MKKLIFLFVLFFSLQILAQDFVKQITHIDNDAKNLKFLKSNHNLFGNSAEYVFESHSDSAVNIFWGYYNSSIDSFYNQISLTDNSYKNLNPTGRKFWGNSSFVIYQSNRNGNWDLFSRKYQNGSWGEEILLFNSDSNEENPVIIQDSQFWFAEDSVKFLYNSNNSIFLATWQDSIINNREIFGGDGSTSFSSFDAAYYHRGFNDSLSGQYIVAQKNRVGLNPQVVYRIFRDNGSLSPEYVFAESPTLTNPGYSIFNFNANLHFEEIINNKRNILIFENWPFSTITYTLLKDNPQGDFSNFTSAPVLIVTKDLPLKKHNDISIYETHSFKLITPNGAFIRTNHDYFSNWQDTLIQTRVFSTPIEVGELGFDGFHLVFYTAWEDSIDEKIGILGRKHLFLLGSVDDDRSDMSFHLEQNYPNPFNPSTTIRYSLTKPELVIIKIFDVLGNEIATLVDDHKAAGSYEVEFNSHSGKVRNLTSGVYFYRMQNGNSFQTRKMLILR